MTVAEYINQNPDWIDNPTGYLRVKKTDGEQVLLCPESVIYDSDPESLKTIREYEVIELVPYNASS